MEFITIIYSNTLQSIMAIVKAMSTLNIGYGHADQQVKAAQKHPPAVFRVKCCYNRFMTRSYRTTPGS